MQINSVINLQNIQSQQNFKGSSANSSPFSNFPSYQKIPLNASKAYASPQITEGYKEIETFDVPYVGKGKLYELANGHKVAIVQKAGPTTINTFVKAGSEDALITSHLLEHLIYNGENTINSTNLTEFFTHLGVTTQATTRKHSTNYFLEYPFNDLENVDKIIKTQADLLQYPSFSEEKFEKEKNVISAEYQRIQDVDDIENIATTFKNTLLGSNKLYTTENYSKKTINKISFEELINFYNKKYQNKNMVSVVVGDINPNEIVKSFTKYFNKPNNTALFGIYGAKTPLQESKRLNFNIDYFEPYNINIGFVGPKNNNEKDNFLASALQIYINKVLKYNSKSNVEMDTLDNRTNPDNTLGLVFITSSESGKEEEKISEVNQFLHELSEKSISDKDIDTIKMQFKNTISIICEKGEVIASLIGIDLVEGNEMYLLNQYKLIDSLTSKDLQNFAKKYFDTQKSLTMTLNYKPKADVKKEPSFKGNIDSINIENIKEYVYPNNLQFIIDKSPGITRTTFSIDLSSIDIPKTKPGVAEILNQMMKIAKDNGLLRENADQIIVESDLSHIKITTNTSPENTLKTINEAKDIILHPNFNQANFEEAKRLYKKIYSIGKSEFDTKLNNIAYKNSPFNFSYSEKLNYIDEIQFIDVINLYNQIILSSQGKAVLTIPQRIFDKNKNEIYEAVSKDLPNLKNKQKINWESKLNTKPFNKTEILTNEIKDNNAKISQSFKVPNPEDITSKDLMTLEITSRILGFDRNSKLFKELRENQGLAYAVYANYDTSGKIGYLNLITEIPLSKGNSNDLQKILNSYKTIIAKLINNPLSEKELETAKNDLKAKYIKNLESSKFRNELMSKLNIQEVQGLFKTIDEIMPSNIQNTAKKYLVKPSLIIVKANQDVINANEDYFNSIGEVV